MQAAQFIYLGIATRLDDFAAGLVLFASQFGLAFRCWLVKQGVLYFLPNVLQIVKLLI